MTSIVSIYAGGIMTLMIATFHVRFPKIFNWETGYGSVSEINKKISHTIHLALLILFFFIGLLSLMYAQELGACHGVSFGLNFMISTFWIWRTGWQIYYFKGKTMHYILIAIFSLLSITYFIPIILKFI